jgi:acetyl esterase/lipase
MSKQIPLKFRIAFRLIKLMMLIVSPTRGNKALPRMNAKVKYGDGIEHERAEISGVPCDVITPAGHSGGRTVIYIHGGGFVYGQTPIHLKYCGLLARRLKARIIAVDYSLDPYPAGLDDCLAAYKAVVDQGTNPQEIAIAGDSAGGCYTLTLLLKARAQNLALPRAAVCISPCGSGRDADLDPDVADPVLPQRACKKFSAHYRGNGDPADPLMSPLFGDFAGMPPILIYCGGRETLLKSVKTLTARAAAEHWDMTLKVEPAMFHIFPLSVTIPEGKRATDAIVAFLDEKLDAPSALPK